MPSGQTQQLWVLAQQDKSKIAEIFGAENVDAVCRELEGEMEKMRKVESVALAIEKNKGQGEGEKRKEDEEVWRGWVEKVYLPRVAKEKKEGGGWKDEKERVQAMHKANPSFVLRNWIAQDAIEAAEKQDYSRVRLVLDLLQDPYYYPEDRPKGEGEEGEGEGKGGMEELTKRYRGMTPAWAAELVCTCSS